MVKKVKWVKQLTRENTLLDRSLRCIAYAKSAPELGKAVLRMPIVGKGKVTSAYYDEDDYGQQQKIIMNECLNGGIKKIAPGIVNFMEIGFLWAKSNRDRKLSEEELIEYLEEFNRHHAHSRAAITYSYWGAPVIEERLRKLLSKKVKSGELDMTMSSLSIPMQVHNKLSDLHHSSDELWGKRKRLIDELNLDHEGLELVEILSWFTYLYELGERVSGYLFDEFLSHLREIFGKEEFEELQWYDSESLANYLRGKKLDKDEIERRKKRYILEIVNGKFRVVSGNEAEKRYHEEFEEKVSENIGELRGTIASLGFAKGQVKIVITREDQKKMKKGDILVSTMTTPRLMEAVKLAGAIVTDEGGLTAHAAIVAREFRIPCIVGTRFATQLLNDGDLIEVDANKGTLKILEKKK